MKKKNSQKNPLGPPRSKAQQFKGNAPSRTVKVKMDKDHLEGIDQAVDSPGSPFSNRSQFIRHAVEDALNKHRPLTDLSYALADLQGWIEVYDCFKTSVQEGATLLTELGGYDAGYEAARFLLNMYEIAQGLENKYWSLRCINFLERRYGIWLDYAMARAKSEG